MKKRLLVIDDDEKLNALLKEYLSGFGYHVSSVIHPDEGLKQIRQSSPDLIILDVMLPGIDGFAVCRTIRETSKVPIIMLTARGEVTDRIVGLEMGADDYLPKPFEPRELAARIQSIFRRLSPGIAREIHLRNLSINIETQTVRLDEDVIDLTTMEFELLVLFARNPGKVLSRDYILDALKGIDWGAFDRSIDVLLSRLRQKLGDNPKNPRWIITIRGAGYKFIGEYQ